MNFLADTNIFLEILLDQARKEDCKRFLSENIDNISISDFSLHSIGVILFRYDKADLFQRFVDDVIPNLSLISLPPILFEALIEAKKKYRFDFDDAYQYCIARETESTLITMDKDFSGVENVQFL